MPASGTGRVERFPALAGPAPSGYASAMRPLLDRRHFVEFGTVAPADLTATILHRLGIDPAAAVRDPRGRPHVLSEGTPVRTLLGL